MKSEAFFDWIKYTFLDNEDINDQTIIRENQNGATPPGDYITFGVISCVPSDYDCIEKEKVDLEHGIRSIANQYRVIVSVNVYSNDAYSMLNRLRLSPSLDSVRPVFKDNEIALLGCSGPKDLTFLGDTAWKPRYQSDFSFRLFATETEIIDLITGYYIGYTQNEEWHNDFVNIGEGISIRENDQYIKLDPFA